MKNYLQEVTEIIAEQLALDPCKIKPQQTLTELGADSLDAVHIIIQLEEAFDCEVSEKVAEKFTTVASIVWYFENNN